MNGIILAAGRGSRLKTKTDKRPKCLNIVHGETFLQWQLNALIQENIKDITIITGYRHEMITDKYNINTLHNKDWSVTNMVSSLFVANALLNANDCIISYSDIIYDSKPIHILKQCKYDIAITYDVNWRKQWNERFDNIYSDAESLILDEEFNIIEIGCKTNKNSRIDGQFMGLIRISLNGWKKIKNYLIKLSRSEIAGLDMTTLLNNLIKTGIKVKGIPFDGVWYEVDNEKDMEIISKKSTLFTKND